MPLASAKSPAPPTPAPTVGTAVGSIVGDIKSATGVDVGGMKASLAEAPVSWDTSDWAILLRLLYPWYILIPIGTSTAISTSTIATIINLPGAERFFLCLSI